MNIIAKMSKSMVYGMGMISGMVWAKVWYAKVSGMGKSMVWYGYDIRDV